MADEVSKQQLRVLRAVAKVPNSVAREINAKIDKRYRGDVRGTGQSLRALVRKSRVTVELGADGQRFYRLTPAGRALI